METTMAESDAIPLWWHGQLGKWVAVCTLDLLVSYCAASTRGSIAIFLLVVHHVVVGWSTISEETGLRNDPGEEFAC